MQAARNTARSKVAAQHKPRPILVTLLRAALWATILSLALVVLYAVALRQAWLGTNTMGPMTAAIKVICAAVAGLLAHQAAGGRFWLWGMLGGLLFSIFSFAIFSIVSQTFVFSIAIFSDMGLAAVAGLFAALLWQMFK
ncbi:MAG: TIGR04086 family membrane protein [Clostridia bacterium]|nr:TIGR04086 family membrane protein [Candidatus Pelethousia sp.]NCB30772.1 TIGR04086 family membrane protein [Clostridia bacterium]